MKSVVIKISDNHIHEIPAEALAGWQLLLGTSTLRETVAAILTAQDTNGGEDERNNWTPAYEQLFGELAEDLNQADTLVKPLSVSGVSLVANGRNETRAALGLPTADVDQLQMFASYGYETADEIIPLPDYVDVEDLESQLEDVSEAVESEMETLTRNMMDMLMSHHVKDEREPL